MNRRWVVLAALAATSLGVSGSEEISHSRGRSGGVVLLWPRLVPQTDDHDARLLAQQLQDKVSQELVAKRGSALVDQRPEPERVCPRQGCRGTSVSLVLGHQEGGCIVAAVVAPPGTDDPGTLVPLLGTMDVPEPSLSFRAPPEDRILVREFVPCDQVLEQLDLGPLWSALDGDSI